MPLVPTDYPQRVAERGVSVNVLAGWESRGGSADHAALVLHHTASSDHESPSSCADYCFYAAQYAPDYNVLVDRTGVAWIGARLKSNSSGEISSVALGEALAGRAGAVSAVQRGLGDDTSANSQLFAISAQNNGIGEPWSAELVHGIAVCAAVALECLGIPSAGYVTQHRVLTSRKIDACGDACPYDFQPLIAAELGGAAPAPIPEVADMWTKHDVLPAGTSRDDRGYLQLGLPAGRKSAEIALYCDCEPSEGASLWAAVNYTGSNQGLWASGKTWEQWLPGRKQMVVQLSANALGVSLQHFGGTKANVTVVLSGT